jgi:DNA invertase Pin-like site-specific DNA recombinase
MSTDMQQYSITNQTRAITGYANSHGMAIVRTYRDDGRSGLTIEHRPGLISLIQDISQGPPGFTAVLVLDVSRWGRFQNSDEAAYYEFLCWKAGIRVCYVGELFENDGTPFAMVVKGIKRAMAAEYSRELSAKTSAGQRNLATLGYHQGALSGYGLRRMLVDASGKSKGLLAIGERKSFATDRVILVPGPIAEVRTVRWIFDQCIAGVSCTDIARALNAKGTLNHLGHRWTYQTVRTVIESEKYVGTAVYGKDSKLLGGKQVANPESMWVRKRDAYRSIVTQDVFDAAQRSRKDQLARMPTNEMLRRARAICRRLGTISSTLIAREPGCPSVPAYTRRFGSLNELYKILGFEPRTHKHYGEVRAYVTDWQRTLTAFTADWLEESGSHVERRARSLTIDHAWTVSFSVLNAHGVNTTYPAWFRHREPEATDIVVFARAHYAEPYPRDYLVLPKILFPKWPHVFYNHNGPAIESCTYPSLAILGDLARLSRMETQLCG